MTNEQVREFNSMAESFQQSAEKVEDGINNVLEPEVKDARISSYETQRLVSKFAKRMTYLFAALLLVNAVTLAIVIAVMGGMI